MLLIVQYFQKCIKINQQLIYIFLIKLNLKMTKYLIKIKIIEIIFIKLNQIFQVKLPTIIKQILDLVVVIILSTV